MTEHKGTHNNVGYTVTIARGNGVVDPRICAQTGGIYEWRILTVVASDESECPYSIKIAGNELPGPSFQGASGTKISICIKPQYNVRMNLA